MTDAKGRYAFLAGPSDYYVTIEKQGYEETSKEVRVKEAEQIVKESVPIKKAGGETDKKSPTDTGSPPQPKQNTT
jgi:uncharacterized membrane protein